MNTLPNREVAIFSSALELDPSQRQAYLDKACAGDPVLRQHLEALLLVHTEALPFMENPPSGTPPSQAGSEGQSSAVQPSRISAEKVGDPIGRYKLLQQIGEGGCGVVYMAEQQEPVRRRVAVKVLKLGMDTKQVVARFEAERQATLALMDHPNIAKVLDAGATETGRPYFVMELVRGIKITDYCDESLQSTEARLGLFIQVCQAIQHAHQKGIIHRDIKPSNILVTVSEPGALGCPKVIDFGIAKATTGQRLTDKTVFTAFEQFIGTPAYMSPEQAMMTSLDIDTRTDIYALGVLLYELLTGQTPFHAKDLMSGGLDAMRRIISEQEPMRPSTRLSTMLAADLTTVARHRQAEPARLGIRLRGDLDWIVMKALEKDRSRRYETANGLAMDIQRHLENEPVLARPPSAGYRFQKLIRRNKGVCSAAGAVGAMLVLGVVASSSEAVRAVRAEQEQARLRSVAESEKKAAQTEASKSQHVADLLKRMLEGVSPSVALGRDTTMLKDIADKAAQRISADLKDEPEVAIELRATLARLYYDLGSWKEGERIARENLRVAREHFGEENLAVAEALNALGLTLVPLGGFTEAEDILLRSISMQRKFRGQNSPQEAFALCTLAYVLRQGGRGEAESAVRTGLAIYRKRLGNESSELAWALDTLNRVLEFQGNLVEAEAVIRESIRIRERIYPEGHQAIAEAYGRLGKTIIMTDAPSRLAEAEGYLRKALELDEKITGPGKISQIYPHLFLAEALQKQVKFDEAEIHYRQGIGLFERLAEGAPKRTDYTYLGHSQWRLAAVLTQTGRREEAEQIQRDARKVFERVAEQFRANAEGGDVGSLDGLAWLLATYPDSNVRDGQRAVDLAKQAIAATHRQNGAYLDTLAAACAELGHFGEAVKIQKEAMALLGNAEDRSPNAYVSRLKLYESGLPFREGN